MKYDDSQTTEDTAGPFEHDIPVWKQFWNWLTAEPEKPAPETELKIARLEAHHAHNFEQAQLSWQDTESSLRKHIASLEHGILQRDEQIEALRRDVQNAADSQQELQCYRDNEELRNKLAEAELQAELTSEALTNSADSLRIITERNETLDLAITILIEKLQGLESSADTLNLTNAYLELAKGARAKDVDAALASLQNSSSNIAMTIKAAKASIDSELLIDHPEEEQEGKTDPESTADSESVAAE